MTDQIEWIYGTSALDVLDKFHESNFVVYVEGDEDIVFWSTLFNKAGIRNHYIESAGGIEELRKTMSQILKDNARVIVACDTDYSMLLNTLPKHDRIISTYGHSIENTMYCKNTLNIVIKNISRHTTDRVNFITQWMEEFCNDSKELIIYDVARDKYGKSVRVFGDNCSRFLKTPRSSKLDKNKITSYISSIKKHFSKDELSESKRLLTKCKMKYKYIINGHFLTNGVINLIKNAARPYLGRRPVIPLSTLYTLTCDGCIRCSHHCPEFAVVEQRINNAVSSIRLM
jgi:hypothetical protein